MSAFTSCVLCFINKFKGQLDEKSDSTLNIARLTSKLQLAPLA